jgi:tol-pal system protein YbgF
LLRLQNDVLALQNQIREFDKTFNERTEGLKSLVVQLNDQVAKSNLLLSKVEATLESQASGVRSNDQAMLQEIRNLSGKIDDAATRISALAQQISELKVQSKALNPGMLQSGSTPGGLSADTVYNQAFNDLVQGNFDLAIQGFTAYLNSFPTGEKAAAAQYNIGEAYYNQNKVPAAIAAFTRIINDYSSSDKVASALFKRGKAELANKEPDNAIADFKQVIEKFPAAPESDLARNELANLGVGLTKPKVPRSKTR